MTYDDSYSKEEFANALSLVATYASDMEMKVETLARMALTELERPPTGNSLERVVNALRMICDVVGDLGNVIGVEAEQKGSGYVDEMERDRRRMLHDALRQPIGVQAK